MKLPTVLGHEFAGEIVRLGERAGEAGLRLGDRVVNLHRPSCRACARCLAGEPILCERAWQSFGHTVDGSYAELVCAHHDVLVPMPAAISPEVGASLMCTAGVALQALRARGKLGLGETVLVTGASGGVGTMAVQLARRMGARVIATTTSEAKVDALRELGAHHVVVAAEGGFHSRVLDLSGGGVDLCLELTGAITFRSALRSLRRGGRMVVIGNIDTRKIELNLGALILYGYQLAGSASCTRRDLLDVFALVEAGELVPRIDRTLPLASAAEAHRLLEARAVVGRIVLVP
jgi:NADPH:quinone reductase-like Zn-dependent oxidoreductase